MLKPTEPKKILCIHDLSGMGRCSLAVILPVLSVMGCQPVALPTVVLSTHTGGLGTPARLDGAAYGLAALEHYRELGVEFDCIYTGYLGGEEQVALAEKAFDLWPAARKVVDPVMGDNGKAYSTVTPALIDRMRGLCRQADLILPNATEAALLLERDFSNGEAGLMTAVRYVRPGHLLCDVGTDHAYLPIWLCQTGVLTPVALPDGVQFPGGALCAIASDVRDGPVERARLHVAAAGLTDRILTVRTDGLSGLENYRPSDITVFGMGGELIVSILERAAFVRSPDVRLILQPMTHPEILRKWLLDNGFSILGELLSAEEHRIYQTVCAAYAPDACAAPYDDAELLTGRAYPPEQTDLHRALICKTRHTLTARRDARAGSGHTTAGEDALLTALAAQEARIARQIR
mgnify:CR=1 FL=1